MAPTTSTWQSNNRNEVLEDIARGKGDGRYQDCVHLSLGEAHAMFRGDDLRFSTRCTKDSLLFPPSAGDRAALGAMGIRARASAEPRCPSPCHSFEPGPEQKRAAEIARNAADAVSAIDDQLAALERILKEDSEALLPGYERSTGRGFLKERLQRWALNTEQILQEKVDETEATRFRSHRRILQGNLDVGSQRCGDFLKVLRQDLVANPEAHFPPRSSPRAVSMTTPATSTEQAVFIVHGHDEANALKLASLIQSRWKLPVIVLKDEAHRGRTIIDKFEQEAARATFAFVFLSPDDLVNVEGASYLQSRPNVFFELGWFYGRLGRERTCLVWKRGGKLPSDLAGVGRVEFGVSVDEAYLDLEKELAAANVIPGTP